MVPKLEAKPYLLENTIQHYAWGNRGEKAIIPQLLEIEPEDDKPYAELWIGAHPKAPSQIKINDTQYPLDQAIQEQSNFILGKKVSKKFVGHLPFLLKVLSAGEALSIQTHPNKATAKKLHKKDPEHYPDDNHKPEIAIAIDSLKALVGFRPIKEIKSMLKKYPEIAIFIGDQVYKKFQKTSENESQQLQHLFSKMMNKADASSQKLQETCRQLKKKIENRSAINERDQLFLELHEKYGNDIGLIVIYFLNLVELQKGQGVFLDAGVPHAYLKGNIIECMANSDNVVRAGLTPKFIDIPTLVEITNYGTGKPEIQNSSTGGNSIKYDVPADEFNIQKYNIKEKLQKEFETAGSLEILFILSGILEITTHSDEIQISRGQTVLIPAGLDRYRLESISKSEVFRVTI